ncbi:hypothetical protein QF034_004438 [Streptomyces africanus]|uniref:Uncharacterized protein n=1 Tax=Streptomyces africanus TaxID=231024 RepID=A0ABU0QV03_9ACTN|nr:hypothetical protein [Streptomyces africanus]MDQ0750207.1 hypothetical protein [Streptomyces africanus]
MSTHSAPWRYLRDGAAESSRTTLVSETGDSPNDLCCPPTPEGSTCIPNTGPNPHVVILLCDLHYDYSCDGWFHLDGRPITEEEHSIAHEATLEEIREADAQTLRYHEYLHSWYEAPEILDRFLEPFLEQLEEKTFGNAIDSMDLDERAKLEQLIGAVTEPLRPFTAYTF